MLKDSYVLEENRIKWYYFRVEGIGRNSKNTVVTGTELYIYLLLLLLLL